MVLELVEVGLDLELGPVVVSELLVVVPELIVGPELGCGALEMLEVVPELLASLELGCGALELLEVVPELLTGLELGCGTLGIDVVL